MPVNIVCQSLKNEERMQSVSFFTGQKEELGVSHVGDPSVMRGTLGLRLSRWHCRGSGPELSPGLLKPVDVLRTQFHTPAGCSPCWYCQHLGHGSTQISSCL